MGELADESRIFLSTLQPERRERRLAMTAVALSVALFATLAPFVRIQMPQVWAFIPIYQSAIVICDLITAGLLLGQFGILRTPSLVVLAGGYLFTACMASVHMLTFPGLFLPSGLLDAGPQTTAWLYMFWHSGFPLCVIFYTLASRRERAEPLYTGRLALPVIVCIGTALVATGAFAALATSGRELLPPIMANNHYTPLMRGVVTTVWLMTLAALILLTSRRPHSVLDLWLIVVLCAWLLDIALSAVLNHGRFDLGFYAGRVYGLVASSFVLLALLLENGKLYARTVHALQGERIEHRRVQEKTVQLNEANELLEQRVAERTRELQAANDELRREIVERERAEEALARSREELREIAAISSTAREQERGRIARELHDELAQTLAMLRLDLERVSTTGNELAGSFMEMRGLLDGAVAATRRIASDLRPLMLDDLGLVPAIQWLVQAFQQRHGIDCTLIVDPPELDLVEPQASTTFRILQESLTNVGRHARASHVDIRLIADDREVMLSVRDNGVGFDTENPRKPNSFGLVGLRERAYLVQGTLSVQTAPGQGTAIEVHIPLVRAREVTVLQSGELRE
ncbi:histidine kinase family protein [Burkholderia pseudomallei MSHR5492]|uniref:sensor histidine kinase n=1 Tax=Burkholderia pseudomallei TaxID=28450 RepID=UPI0005310883|nr:sensor histidine kinase [Burkholderia pseudomallei]KGS40409.1 histidine kinase family protein [Burkholderia pseudomallei MSHR5492]ONC19096.1 histidine kinase [Burkholderia pseudomallei]